MNGGEESTGGDASRLRRENRILGGVLGVLCVIAMVLVVGVIVINANSGIVKSNSALPDELKGEDLPATDQVIREASIMLQDPNYNNADIEKYYDTVVAEATRDGDNELALEVIIQKMDFIAVVEGDCDRAKEYVDSLDLIPYSGQEQSVLSSYVISMAGSCGDQDLQSRWRELYDEMGEEE